MELCVLGVWEGHWTAPGEENTQSCFSFSWVPDPRIGLIETTMCKLGFLFSFQRVWGKTYLYIERWNWSLLNWKHTCIQVCGLIRISWIDYYQRKLHSDRKSRMHSSLSWPRVFFSIYWAKVWGGRFLLEHKRLQSHPCCCIGSRTMSLSRVQCLRK